MQNIRTPSSYLPGYRIYTNMHCRQDCAGDDQPPAPGRPTDYTHLFGSNLSLIVNSLRKLPTPSPWKGSRFSVSKNLPFLKKGRILTQRKLGSPSRGLGVGIHRHNLASNAKMCIIGSLPGWLKFNENKKTVPQLLGERPLLFL